MPPFSRPEPTYPPRTDVHEIPLSFHRSDFEDIFFADGKNRLFSYPYIVKEFYFLLAALLFLGVGLLVFFLNHQWVVLPILGLAMAGFIGWNLALKAQTIIRWRKGLKTYIDGLAKTKSFRLSVSDTSLSLIQDGHESLCKWDIFTQADIHAHYIHLRGKETFYFPKGSMAPDHFILLSNLISKRFHSAPVTPP